MGYKPMVLHKDNPFRNEIEAHLKSGQAQMSGMLVSEKVTLTKEVTYMTLPWVKLFQHKDKLQALSPWACKILVYIGLNMEMNQQQLRLPCKALGLTRPKYDQSLRELIDAGILSKADKREHYWINLTIIICGHIEKRSGFERLIEE